MSFETGGTCVLAWKRKTGLGGSLLSHQKWEQRWIVLADDSIQYYKKGDEALFGEADYAPRGKIDLLKTTTSVQVSSNPSNDAPTHNEVDIVSEATEQDKKLYAQLLKASQSDATKATPPPPPLAPTVHWKLCFDSQEELVEFLEKAHSALQRTGQLQEKDAARFEHDFQPADHIYRWEMIVCPPVIYPIQIHGIVLEAGRNCVVVADFGLTGYGKQKKDADFHHVEDNDKHNAIVNAFKKLRPNSDQRLHITTLTDPMDLRKWTKAHYDETSLQAPDALKKLTKITQLLGKVGRRTAANAKLQDEIVSAVEAEEAAKAAATESERSELSGGDDTGENDESEASLGASASMDSNNSQHRQSSFSEEYARQRQEDHPLPKADPKEIVLSRANFVLEFGEDKLPPYHVFFSNSECIAVWCKTGRWSTLQTAVFLSSNSIGGAKSATVATLGVAAAHAILAPVVALGGLVWVSAPMVILKHSRKKWEENTLYMTDLYWQWAPPSVFVCAIEHWSEVGYSTQQKLALEDSNNQSHRTLNGISEDGSSKENNNDKNAEPKKPIKKYTTQAIEETRTKMLLEHAKFPDSKQDSTGNKDGKNQELASDDGMEDVPVNSMDEEAPSNGGTAAKSNTKSKTKAPIYRSV